jgi:ribosome biogenesis GTPase / thiamine phosphate phosphatase
MQGKIVGNVSNIYQIKTENNIYKSYARGKLKQEEIIPMVGDIVEIEIIDEEKQEAIIEKIKTRKNEIKRPKISNIDQIIFIISIKNPKPDLLMLDKQLVYVENLNIEPIIVINKIDLSDKYKTIEELYCKIGYKVIPISNKEKIGIEKLKEELKGKTSVFAGNSGVGKSSTINALFEENKTLEGEISKKNKKGKNTTTETKLYELEQNTYIADTPGFSNFEITEIESKELDMKFREFKDNIPKCEFVGCTHIKEKNCEIKKAIESGEISKERYERYCKIYEELKEREKYRW